MAQVSEEREDRVDATGEHPAATPGTPEPGAPGIPATPEFPGTAGASATSESGRTAETPVAPESSGAGEATRLSAAGTAEADTPAAGTADAETGASDTPAPPEAVKKASKAGRNLPDLLQFRVDALEQVVLHRIILADIVEGGGGFAVFHGGHHSDFRWAGNHACRKFRIQ